jgi:hypothetical protein
MFTYYDSHCQLAGQGIVAVMFNDPVNEWVIAEHG